MPAASIFYHKLHRVLSFGVVTLVVALVLNRYATVPFHFVQLFWGVFGMLIGAVEQFFFTGRLARAPVWLQLVLRVVMIWALAMGLVSALILVGLVPPVFREEGIVSVAALWSSTEALELMTNSLIVATGVMLFMEMERMVGSRMFRRFITGRYVHPKREDRIVMFLDITGSTTMTEKLGDRRYFDMLNHCFDRMTGPILASNAEILKYVGDEVILMWPAESGAHRSRCLDLYFDIIEGIARDAAYYTEHYGVVPRFQGALHRGEVIVAQIGTVKRSIDLSGDAMNTCARLTGLAKEHGGFVVSEDLLTTLPDAASRFTLGPRIPVELRGKEHPVTIRAVARGLVPKP